jgi:hypothetical protein
MTKFDSFKALSLFDRVRSFYRRNVTLVGKLFLAVLVLSVVFVFWLGWTGFAAATIIAVFFIVTSFPFIIGRANYEVSFEIEYDSVVAGDEVPGTVIVKNVGKSLAFAQKLEIPMINEADSSIGTTAVLNIPNLRPGKSHRDTFMLPTNRRAVFNVGPVVGVKTDPIHIFRIEHIFGKASKLFVHPVTLPLPSSQIGMIRDIEGDPTEKITQSDISFHDIRDYVPGDPIRNINWKATARLDKLQVRQFEESRRAKIVFAISTNDRDYMTDVEFELTISAMASLGYRAAADNREIEVVTSQNPPEFVRNLKLDIIVSDNRTPRGVLDSFSGVAKSPKDLDITEVCQKIADKLNDISLCVIGVGSARTLDNIRKAALQLPDNVELIVIAVNPKQLPKTMKLSNITYISLSVLEDLKQIVAKKVM